MNRLKIALLALTFIGLGGALLSSSWLAGATLFIALTGIALSYRKALPKAGWDEPKELRLLHFAFWFFVVASALSWFNAGLGYEGFKTLGSDVRFILFWPLIIALTYSELRASTLFLAFGLTALSALAAVLAHFAQSTETLTPYLAGRLGGGINPIMFGNLALLGGALSLVGGLYFRRQPSDQIKALVLIIAGLAALVVAGLSQTRSNLIALPVLLLLITPLLTPRLRRMSVLVIIIIAAVSFTTSDRIQTMMASLSNGVLEQGITIRFELWQLAWNLFLDNPILGAGLNSFTQAAAEASSRGDISPTILTCCTGHAHNDVLNLMATRGIAGLLSWLFLLGVPLFIFGRYITSRHPATAHMAVAGTMVPAAYIVFGLTEATLSRNLYLTFYLLLIASVSAAFFRELSASCYRPRSVTVSATVITMNEADHIADCLQSARLVADEIIVLDSGSSDGTADIARQYADVVEVTDWPGFGIQKQRALEKATGDWVLSIDADERITPELASEINHRLAEPDADAYKLPWAVTIYGKRLDFGRSGRAPLRLFRREGVRFSDALVHEKILIPDGRKTRTLRGRLTHYTHRDFGHSLEKSSKYAWLGAQEKYRQGKQTRTMVYPTLRALLTFVQVYFIRFGFLDGSVGYLTAVTYAQVTFNKYAGLWTLGKAYPKNDAKS
ncbi:O-antigen ligase family protein [Marinobacter caseinilyticus]|uniref:O-antigen ligase family protein n=1 Tax=Marinobacter caseinilyticus TaxID=2692195 RepID=UPI001407DE51|nr:O-antigen ligase family protein [Marinobacter caseinilyticus]